MTKPIKRRKFRQSCEQNIAARIERNKMKLEGQALREFLSKDAPTREREKLAQSKTN